MNKIILIPGDILAILIVTVVGFAAHGEAGAGSPSLFIILLRMAATCFPLSISWFLLAPWFGLFQQEFTSNPKHLWRSAFAMFFSAPLAVVLRGLILDEPIIPIFAVVLAVTSAFGMSLWRGIYLLLNRKAR